MTEYLLRLRGWGEAPREERSGRGAGGIGAEEEIAEAVFAEDVDEAFGEEEGNEDDEHEEAGGEQDAEGAGVVGGEALGERAGVVPADDYVLYDVAEEENDCEDGGVPEGGIEQGFAFGALAGMEEFGEPHEFGEDEGVDESEAEAQAEVDVILLQDHGAMQGEEREQEPEVAGGDGEAFEFGDGANFEAG